MNGTIPPEKNITIADTIETLLSENPKKPLNNVEMKTLYHLITRYRNTIDKEHIQVRSGTNMLHLLHVPVPRPGKDSSLVSSPIKKKRTQIINKVTALSSGANQNPDAFACQKASDLKHLSKKVKNEVAEKAGMHASAVNVLDCKTFTLALHLSDNKIFRQLKPFLRNLNVGMPTTKEMKEFEKALASEYKVIDVELEVPDKLVANKHSLQTVEVVMVNDLEEFVYDLTKRYDEAGLLQFEGALSNIIGVKVVGDFGGGSFKLMLQIANVEGCNSKHSTHIFCMTDQKDTHYNLKKLTEHFKLAFTSLDRTKFVLFFFYLAILISIAPFRS